MNICRIILHLIFCTFMNSTFFSNVGLGNDKLMKLVRVKRKLKRAILERIFLASEKQYGLTFFNGTLMEAYFGNY